METHIGQTNLVAGSEIKLLLNYCQKFIWKEFVEISLHFKEIIQRFFFVFSYYLILPFKNIKITTQNEVKLKHQNKADIQSHCKVDF
jgi:hypothetical protein